MEKGASRIQGEELLRISSPFMRLIMKLTFSNWWVILYLLVVCQLFEQGVKELSETREQLQRKEKELSEAIALNLKKRKESLERLGSVDDDLWIEKLLIMQLGLVPEGSRKIYFREQ